MKGSKKYAGHEYSFTSPAKSGLGKELGKQKSAASSSRADSRTYAKKMDQGGTVSNPNNPSSMGVPSGVLSALSGAASNPQGAVKQGRANGGEVKKKDNRKDIGDDNKAGSVYELGSSYEKGGKVKAENESQKPKVKGDSPKNDLVPIQATEGEFVVKRSIMQSKDAPKKAAAAIKKEKDKKKK